ncbi:hypothetical protein ACFX5E_07930 [Flavobacterium sp. LS2P90]|uniref:Uncharacterized protein n=1 Tax=Flavobacterium xylosi TaxID=3230415 RepID=A0ABW6HWB8_9FLAO
MHHTFSREEYKEFLLVEFLKSKDYDENFSHLTGHFESLKYWEIKISSINNILTIILEQLEKRGIDTNEIIKFIYELPLSYDFLIQETDIRFIDTLYKNILSPNLVLEDYLIDTQYSIYGK